MFGGSGSSDEAKKAKDLLIAQYFGEVNLTNRMNFSAYKHAVRYFEQELKLQDEQVLAAVTTKMTVKKMTGILVATSHRLVFVANGMVHGRYFEVLEYDQMRGIGLSADGLTQTKLSIPYGDSTIIFEDIFDDDHFKYFYQIVQNQMSEARKKAVSSIITVKTIQSTDRTDSKYERLAQIAKLRDQGILTEEEFQREKEKILNS